MNNRKKINLFIFNKYVLIVILVWSLLCISGTYAFYSFEVEEESVIAGNVISIDADLEVELVVGTNTKMVPMLDGALSNAINGVGSSNGACIDNKGNLSCQIYKITLINKGSRLKHLNGSVELYAKEGNENTYNNLKWRELTDLTTVKSGSVVNEMSKSYLVQDLTIESKETKIWYIAVWISEIDSDQLLTDKGLFGGTVTFETVGSGDGITTPFIRNVMMTNARSDKGVDFDMDNYNGVYVKNETENNMFPIYYYRESSKNYLIFANTCWRIVRTTETGGLKLLYSGLPNYGQCNNVGDKLQIGVKSYNELTEDVEIPSLSSINYMHPGNDKYMITYFSISELDSYNYLFANDVNYSNGTYTLVNTKKLSEFINLDQFDNYHYFCLSTTEVCDNSEGAFVGYIYSIMDSSFLMLILFDGEKIEDAIDNAFGIDDGSVDGSNLFSSTIKGDKDTVGTLDYWFYNNIFAKGYSKYIEDTVWCNDRSIYSIGSFNPNGGKIVCEDDIFECSLLFNPMYRYYNMKVSFSCNRNIDKFTVSQKNGNGFLDYPVGLLTLDEVRATGLTDSNYWLMTPLGVLQGIPSQVFIDDTGTINANFSGEEAGVRPAISLKPDFSITGSGDGSASRPYVVQ